MGFTDETTNNLQSYVSNTLANMASIEPPSERVVYSNGVRFISPALPAANQGITSLTYY
jgi:hypothetical protein